jgi:hypothetical protein
MDVQLGIAVEIQQLSDGHRVSLGVDLPALGVDLVLKTHVRLPGSGIFRI